MESFMLIKEATAKIQYFLVLADSARDRRRVESMIRVKLFAPHDDTAISKLSLCVHLAGLCNITGAVTELPSQYIRLKLG